MSDSYSFLDSLLAFLFGYPLISLKSIEIDTIGSGYYVKTWCLCARNLTNGGHRRCEALSRSDRVDHRVIRILFP